MWQNLDISRLSKVSLACTAKLSCLACNRTEQRPEWASLYFCRKTGLRWNCGRRVIVQQHRRSRRISKTASADKSFLCRVFFKGASNFVYKTRAAITTLQNHLPKKKQGQIGLERSRGRHSGSHGVRDRPSGSHGARDRPSGSQGAHRFSWGQGVGLQVPVG